MLQVNEIYDKIQGGKWVFFLMVRCGAVSQLEPLGRETSHIKDMPYLPGVFLFNELCTVRTNVILTSEEVLSFLTRITEGRKQLTRRTRYSHLKTFFNFIQNNLDRNLLNPSDTPMLRKLFRPAGTNHWNILEKEVVDEIIFRTTKARNRLLLELMARGGMRISEVLKLTTNDIDQRKLILRGPGRGGRVHPAKGC